jgi:mycoredoxin
LKKIIVFAAVFGFVFAGTLGTAYVGYKKWDTISLLINPPPDYSAAHNGQAVLYGNSWCGYCQKARDLLAANNIAYFEYDIEKSEEGLEQFKRLNGRGTPVLYINGTVIKGYDSDKILDAIKD